MKKWFLHLFIISSIFFFTSCSSKIIYKHKNIYDTSNKEQIATNNFSNKKSNKYSNKTEKFIKNAKEYLGTPYFFGGLTKKGIDCSGLVYKAYQNSFNKKISRTAYMLYKKSKHIEYPSRGDLIFFRFKFWHSIDHVAIYLGGQKFIHASSSRGVIISKFNNYYNRKIVGYGRIKL